MPTEYAAMLPALIIEFPNAKRLKVYSDTSHGRLRGARLQNDHEFACYLLGRRRELETAQLRSHFRTIQDAAMASGHYNSRSHFQLIVKRSIEAARRRVSREPSTRAPSPVEWVHEATNEYASRMELECMIQRAA